MLYILPSSTDLVDIFLFFINVMIYETKEFNNNNKKNTEISDMTSGILPAQKFVFIYYHTTHLFEMTLSMGKEGGGTREKKGKTQSMGASEILSKLQQQLLCIEQLFAGSTR